MMAELLDFTRLTRPKSPNTFLLAPEGLCQHAVPDESAPSFDVSPVELYGRVKRLVQAERRWTLNGEVADQLQLAFVAATPLLGFRDDVDVLVYPSAAGQTVDAHGAHIAIYSRSRVGYSDLGANAKRVRTLIKKLQADEEGS